MATYDERRSAYYGHQAANLKSREGLQKRGVKKGTPNLPVMDATHKGAEKRLRQGDAQRKTDAFFDQLMRSLEGK